MYGFPISSLIYRFILLLLFSLIIIVVIIEFSLLIGMILVFLLFIFIFYDIIGFKLRFIKKRSFILTMMINVIRLNGSEHILDLGTGAGYVAIGLAKQLKTGKVYGLDKYDVTPKRMCSKIFDEIRINFFGNTLKNAKKNALLEKQNNTVEFIQSDLTNGIPFADSSIDVVVSSQFLYCISPEKLFYVLKDINRVLKPNGVLVFFESKRFFNWDLDQVTSFFKERGYDHTIVESNTFSNKVIYVGKKSKDIESKDFCT